MHRYVRCKASAERGRSARAPGARSPPAPGPGRWAVSARRPDRDSSPLGPCPHFALQLAHVAEKAGNRTYVHVITHGNPNYEYGRWHPHTLSNHMEKRWARRSKQPGNSCLNGLQQGPWARNEDDLSVFAFWLVIIAFSCRVW